MFDFGGNILRISEKKNLKEADLIKNLAETCKVSGQTVRNWLNNMHIPDKVKLEKIADYLECKVYEFFAESSTLVQEPELNYNAGSSSFLGLMYSVRNLERQVEALTLGLEQCKKALGI